MPSASCFRLASQPARALPSFWPVGSAPEQLYALPAHPGFGTACPFPGPTSHHGVLLMWVSREARALAPDSKPSPQAQLRRGESIGARVAR